MSCSISKKKQFIQSEAADNFIKKMFKYNDYNRRYF